MPGAALEIKVEGIKGLSDIFQKMEAAGLSYRIPLNLCGIHMLKSVDQNFRNQGIQELGIIWPPLSEWTKSARRKGRKGSARSAQMLQDTGRLRMSITRQKARGQIYRLSNVALVFGTNVEYASTHQFGKRTTTRVRVWKGPFKRRKPGGRRKVVQVQGHASTMVQPPVPARPFLAIKPSDQVAIGRIFSTYYVHAMTGRFLSGGS